MNYVLSVVKSSVLHFFLTSFLSSIKQENRKVFFHFNTQKPHTSYFSLPAVEFITKQMAIQRSELYLIMEADQDDTFMLLSLL